MQVDCASALAAQGLGAEQPGGNNGQRPGGLESNGGADHPGHRYGEEELAAPITTDQLLQRIESGGGWAAGDGLGGGGVIEGHGASG